MVGTWMLMCLIIGAVYKSNLMAMLITPRVVRPFETLEQLVDSNIPFYVAKGSYLEAAVKVTVLINARH